MEIFPPLSSRAVYVTIPLWVSSRLTVQKKKVRTFTSNYISFFRFVIRRKFSTYVCRWRSCWVSWARRWPAHRSAVDGYWRGSRRRRLDSAGCRARTRGSRRRWNCRRCRYRWQRCPAPKAPARASRRPASPPPPASLPRSAHRWPRAHPSWPPVLPRAAAAATAATAAAAVTAAPAHSSAPTSTGFQVDHARCRQHPMRRIRSPPLRSSRKKVERYVLRATRRTFLATQIARRSARASSPRFPPLSPRDRVIALSRGSWSLEVVSIRTGGAIVIHFPPGNEKGKRKSAKRVSRTCSSPAIVAARYRKGEIVTPCARESDTDAFRTMARRTLRVARRIRGRSFRAPPPPRRRATPTLSSLYTAAAEAPTACDGSRDLRRTGLRSFNL